MSRNAALAIGVAVATAVMVGYLVAEEATLRWRRRRARQRLGACLRRQTEEYVKLKDDVQRQLFSRLAATDPDLIAAIEEFNDAHR